MVAGELPADPNGISAGSGPVSIDANVIQANLANDDGGGIRLLQTTGSNVATPGCTRTAVAHLPGEPGRHRHDRHHQQHDREQRLRPRGRRHRPGRRGVRQHRQQHGRQEHHHGDRGHQRRAAGTGRAVHGRHQRPAAGPAGQPARLHGRCSPTARPSPARPCSTTSSRTTTPARTTAGWRAASPMATPTGWDVGIPDNPGGIQLAMDHSWFQNATDTLGSGERRRGRLGQRRQGQERLPDRGQHPRLAAVPGLPAGGDHHRGVPLQPARPVRPGDRLGRDRDGHAPGDRRLRHLAALRRGWQPGAGHRHRTDRRTSTEPPDQRVPGTTPAQRRPHHELAGADDERSLGGSSTGPPRRPRSRRAGRGVPRRRPASSHDGAVKTVAQVGTAPEEDRWPWPGPTAGSRCRPRRPPTRRSSRTRWRPPASTPTCSASGTCQG